MSYGERIRRLRKCRRLKQEDLAKVLGVHPSAISNYERETREMDYKTLLSMCDFFGCSTDYLLTGKVPVRRRTNGPRE